MVDMNELTDITYEVDAGLAEQELDRRDERLHVATSLGDLEEPDDALVATDGDADALGGGLDAEDQHRNSSHASAS